MEDIRGVRLRKFNLRKIILGVRMHFRHTHACIMHDPGRGMNCIYADGQRDAPCRREVAKLLKVVRHLHR